MDLDYTPWLTVPPCVAVELAIWAHARGVEEGASRNVKGATQQYVLGRTV